MNNTTEIDLSAIEVPGSLRLNMDQRKHIAGGIRDKANKAQEAKRDREAEQVAVCTALYPELWGGEENLKIAQSMPQNLFKVSNRISFTLYSVKEHQTGLTSEDTKRYVDRMISTFMNIKFTTGNDYGYDSVILPYFSAPDNYNNRLFIVDPKDFNDPLVKAYLENKDLVALSEEMNKQVFDFITYETRINQARKTLWQMSFEALKTIKTVRKLQEEWPGAFEIYYELFGHYISGNKNALVAAPQVSAVSKMIEDFPDIEELMVA